MALVKTYSQYQCSAVLAAVAAGAPIAALQFVQGQASLNKGSVAALTLLRVVATTAVGTTFAFSKCVTAGTPNPAFLPGTNEGGVLVGQGNGGYVGDLGARLVTNWAGAGVLPTFNLPAVAVQSELDVLPATIGAGFEWTWSEDTPFMPTDLQAPPFLLPGRGFVLFNAGAGPSPAMVVTMRWMEFYPVGVTGF